MRLQTALRILVFSLSAMLGGDILAADAVVVTSTQPGLVSGQVIDGAKPISIDAGNAVTLISESGNTIELKGPYAGAPDPEKPASADRNVFNALVQAFGGTRQSTSTLAATRGIAIKEKKTGTTVALYDESHALVIGVSDYTGGTGGWPRLKGVKDDIPAVKAALEAQGFNVQTVMNPDRRQLDDSFRAFIDQYGLKPNNRLLFYFAGHGHSMKLGYGGMMGYLVGYDAPNPNVDKAGFRRKSLSMEMIENYARNIESKHALFLFDACFAGSVFDATRAIPEVIAAKTGKPVRQFITSGTAEQQVPDTSIFRRQFEAALKGEGDLDDDDYITGAELGQFLETQVTNYSRRAQTPQYGKLRDPLLDKGDFVFALPQAAEQTEPVSTRLPPSGSSTEVVFWQSIRNSTNSAMFEEYLRQYPHGQFIGLARIKIDELKNRQTASLTPADVTPEPAIEDIRSAQVLLKELDYDPGPADGVMGQGTQKAIERFQKANKLSVDGTVSVTLLTALKDATKQVAALTPAPKPTTPPAVQPAVGVFPKTYKPIETFKDCLDCPEMVIISPGSFRMGDLSGDGSDDEKPVHEVRIDYSFAVGKYEVTQAEWQAVMGNNPSKFKQMGDQYPVEQISWDDAKTFVDKLSTKTGEKYRLLSESEWEYVARAGSTTSYPWGKSIDPSRAKYSISSTTAMVGQYSPNAFGIHDLIGNVWEWTEDCWNDSYRKAPKNGSARTSGECQRRVLRGGSWDDYSKSLRTANRISNNSFSRSHDYGFRVARALRPEEVALATPEFDSDSSQNHEDLSKRTPKEKYIYAFNLMRQEKYQQAEEELLKFLDSYSDHILSEKAQYWLGQIYYIKSDYVKAAEAFFKGYMKNQTGPQTPDNLLKLGLSMRKLGKRPEACASFNKVLEYEDASDNVRRFATIEIKKSCS